MSIQSKHSFLTTNCAPDRIMLEVDHGTTLHRFVSPPSLNVSRYAPRFCPPPPPPPPFSASGRSFYPPKFDHVYHFIQILLGLISKAPHFQYVDNLFAPQIEKIYRFIQILLGPILNFERRTPNDFDLECPPPPPPPPPPRVLSRRFNYEGLTIFCRTIGEDA